MTTDQRGALRGKQGLNAGGNLDIGAFQGSIPAPITTVPLVPVDLSTPVPAAVVAPASVVAAPSTMALAPLIGPTPFHVRTLGAKGRRRAKANHPAGAVHPAAHSAAHAATRRPVTIRIARPKHGRGE